MQSCRKCPDAVAEIRGGMEAPQLTGCVQLYQEKGCVLIVARVSGLPGESKTGFFGFHIHQGESCSGTDFSKTGSHYNPTGQAHPKHAGDLPPLLSCRGNAYLSVKTDRFTCSGTDFSKTGSHYNPTGQAHPKHAGDLPPLLSCRGNAYLSVKTDRFTANEIIGRTVGSHYNPTGQAHPKHAGDLPPLLSCRGNAYLSVKTDRFTANEIIGRTVVIHSDPDDFNTQPAGNAGKKIACGVIRKRR